MRVYSVIHGRSIEVCESEIASLSSTTMFRQQLTRLKTKARNEITMLTTSSREDKFVLQEVDADDNFIYWANSEQDYLPHMCTFIPPRKATIDIQSIDTDPNRAVLFEDGIEEIVLKYLSDFTSEGTSTLILCCMSWLGKYFP